MYYTIQRKLINSITPTQGVLLQPKQKTKTTIQKAQAKKIHGHESIAGLNNGEKIYQYMKV